MALYAARGALIGGIVADVTGGDFWQGAKAGAISGAVYGFMSSDFVQNIFKPKSQDIWSEQQPYGALRPVRDVERLRKVLAVERIVREKPIPFWLRALRWLGEAADLASRKDLPEIADFVANKLWMKTFENILDGTLFYKYEEITEHNYYKHKNQEYWI